MEKTDVKNMAANVSNKPFLAVLAIVVLGVCVFTVFALSKAVESKIALLETEKTTVSVQGENAPQGEETTEKTNNLNVGTIKKYSDSIENVYLTKEAARIALTVEFTDEAALLEDHYAPNSFSIDVAPVFCFYIENGATQIKIPGELRLLSDGKTVVYYLSELDDYKNAVAQTEDFTITLDNVMTNEFNLYLQHKTRDGVGKTILGTYGKSYEQFKASYFNYTPKTVDVNEDIKNIEVTSVDEFVWIDVYFRDEDGFNKFVGDMGQGFMCFGIEHAGKLFKEIFIVSEYQSVNMLRLKFDDFAMSELLKEMGEDKLTVKELFEDYDIEIWATDYRNETPLFCLNDKVEVREKLNNSMSGNDER